jgi:hypothetical protein
MGGKPGQEWRPSGQGKGITFLREHVAHEGDDCLIWPLSRRANGYAVLGFEGTTYYAHRLMCELASGPAPTPDHEAAHSCGRGHEGCVNPKHLSWKTASENHLDRRRHGTHATNRTGPIGTITREQKREIQALEGKHTQVEIGAMYGVPFQTISRIFREDLDRPSGIRLFTEEENAYVIAALNRNEPHRKIAEHLGRSVAAIDNKAIRMRRKQR